MAHEDLLSQILDLASLDASDLDGIALETARLSFYDWIVVSCAGSSQPLASIMRDFIAAEEGAETATVTGALRKYPPRAAALVNGAISHALDYDDTHFSYVGHPSVVIFPAALAAAEEEGASTADLCAAFLRGAEASCRIGMVLGRRHYDAGFHQTATSGCFGATVAVANLYGLDRKKLTAALGLASTRASGLKSQFGTMGKPYNAGMAAANAIEVCGLARRGFTSVTDGLCGLQGFVPSHHSQNDNAITDWRTQFFFKDVRHKLHACCHGTHAMIEALRKMVAVNGLAASTLVSLTIRVNPRWLQVCDIKTPSTGLEIKFSYAFLAAMVLHNIDTAAYQSYRDSLCGDELLANTARQISVIGDEAVNDSAAELVAKTISDAEVKSVFDLMAPIDLAVLGPRLVAKASALIGVEKAEKIWKTLCDLDNLKVADVAQNLQL